MEKYIDNKYCYRTYITSVYDGDTVTCNIDLGFGIIINKQKIRLFGINAPELRGEEREEGIIIRDKLRNLILEKWVNLYTIKDSKGKDSKGKYGRWLGIIVDNNININELLLKDDLVKEYI